MPKFLVEFSYTGEGLKGLAKEGGSKRREVIEQLVNIMGGRLEAYYFCYGEYDGIAIVDSRDMVSHIAGILAINGSGLVKTKTTVLITPEEIDQAVKKIPLLSPARKIRAESLPPLGFPQSAWPGLRSAAAIQWMANRGRKGRPK